MVLHFSVPAVSSAKGQVKDAQRCTVWEVGAELGSMVCFVCCYFMFKAKALNDLLKIHVLCTLIMLFLPISFPRSSQTIQHYPTSRGPIWNWRYLSFSVLWNSGLWTLGLVLGASPTSWHLALGEWCALSFHISEAFRFGVVRCPTTSPNKLTERLLSLSNLSAQLFW